MILHKDKKLHFEKLSDTPIFVYVSVNCNKKKLIFFFVYL